MENIMENKDFGFTSPAGPAFEDFSMEEMVAMQGSGDVQADTTPVLSVMLVSSYTITVATAVYATTHR